MREYLQALRAIWASWHDGASLNFQGQMYRHLLMTPMFTPARHEWGPPPVFLAGVGERMTEVAGELADGYVFHAFTTDRYLREVTLPALAGGRTAGVRPDAIRITGPALVATGRSPEELARAITGTRNRIAFYASTPAYRKVLELHGWGELQTELNRLSKQGEWDAMGELIDDTVLHAFATVGSPAAVAHGLRERYGDVVDRISLYMPYDVDPAQLGELTRAV